MAKTKVEIKDTKYGRMFTIWKVLGVTSEGEKILSESPVVRFGRKKAVAINAHTKELELFADGLLREKKVEDTI